MRGSVFPATVHPVVVPMRAVYNKAEYADQRRHMLQEWANMVDAWTDGQTYVPKLMPDNVVVPVLSATA